MMTKFEANEQTQQQAAEYVARLYSGELSAKEEHTIRAWCAADSRHQREFDNMVAIWDTSQELYETADDNTQVRSYKIALNIAASLIVALAIGLYMVLPNSTVDPIGTQMAHVANEAVTTQSQPTSGKDSHRYQTQVGEVKDVTLPDGTLVSLNTDTAIEYDFSGDTRNLLLKRGEAFFAVAKDPSKVFIIDTGKQIIRVIGTKFNVRKSTDSLQVAVKEGLVAVHAADKKHQAFEHKTEDTLLPAGTIGAFSGAGKIVSADQTDKVERLQSWRFGFFRFDNESMETVVTELNRYQLKPIVLLGDKVKKLRISGVYSLRNQDSLFQALEQVLPIRVSSYPEQIFIEAKKS
jgi:transmembrane sensor